MSMDKYEVLEHIGDGAFDSGLLMRHEVGKKYLLKKIQLEPQTDRSHRSSLKEAGGDGGGVLNRRKVPALSAASSVRSLCRVPAQHLVSILAVFADVLAGNKATPVATAQLVTIMQPEGISPTVGSNGSLSHATDSLIVRMIVLNSADVLPFRRNVDGDAMLNSGPLVVSRSGDEHDLRRSFRCSFRTWLMTQVTAGEDGVSRVIRYLLCCGPAPSQRSLPETRLRPPLTRSRTLHCRATWTTYT
ncbi:uncharacterized protein [Lolium perenne]|uniref:uncharacterized protein isoform X2 n=2 Tax=Lolium perenne TaxID=4522 RepID=UPI0021F514BD|nr:uncharacterized protein LOC127314161 isoform X2 [Lolium perenne]XP_051200587.1 uncharacterized protein LOC127314161 isoform X3 [Lolium perenne]